MDVSLIFGAIAVIFLGLTLWRRQGTGGPTPVQQRIWLFIAGVFGVVAIVLHLVG